MSWNNVVPYWVYELIQEHNTAKITGAFDEEWVPKWSRALPERSIRFYQEREHYDASSLY